MPLNNHKQLKQDIANITQEMYERNQELADINRTLSLLRSIDILALHSHESVKVLSVRMAEAISRAMEYPLVMFLGQSSHEPGYFQVYGANVVDNQTLSAKTLANIHPSITHPWLSINQRLVFLSIKDLSPDQVALTIGCSPYEAAQFQQAFGLGSICIIKLQARQGLVGLMVIGSHASIEDFSRKEMDFLERLSEAVGVALDNRLLFEENQNVLQELQVINAKLRELDRTKDEFIYMASHQLRTPLTTVKGYLSMVLDGDVEKVTANEKLMLKKAFDGAQRMVYLIADLLNVSRLQSGKFVIQNKLTNLADLVASEIDQLQEIAKSRNLTVTYQKTPNFPDLMLDEEKIRQVVMNFLDNAIYYTPKGGQILIKADATPQTVTLTVADNGMGVPLQAQYLLFNKYFRANNAKKMRPDGTGLGLYMAKKVITAQGGAIIFKSTLGKGSVFGFSIPRKAVEMKTTLFAKSA